MRANPIRRFYNRQQLVDNAKPFMTSGKFTLFVGPPSSGKTALAKHVMPPKCHCINLDLRAVNTNEPSSVINAFRAAFLACSKLEQSEHSKALWDAIDAVKDSNYIVSGLPNSTKLPNSVLKLFCSGTDSLSANAENFIVSLDFILDYLLKDGSKVLIFIDEYAELFSKGKENLEWKNDLAHALENVLIKHTKQRDSNPATAIITTSDQQYYDHFDNLREKGFLTTMCLGYMSDDQSNDYLEHALNVKSAEHRDKIVAHAGGHFTELKRLADGIENLDAELAVCQAERRDSLRGALCKLCLDDEKTFLETIAPTLAAQGFMKDASVDKRLLASLVRNNVVSIRYPMAQPGWCVDLPPMSSKCITPYIPSARGALKEMMEKEGLGKEPEKGE